MTRKPVSQGGKHRINSDLSRHFSSNQVLPNNEIKEVDVRPYILLSENWLLL